LFARNLHELAVSARFQRHRSDRLAEIAKRIAVTSQTGEKEMLLMTGIFRRAVPSSDTFEDVDRPPQPSGALEGNPDRVFEPHVTGLELLQPDALRLLEPKKNLRAVGGL